LAAWPHVDLREVLRPDLAPVPVNPSEAYEMAGVYSFGRGLFRKEPVHGSNTSYRFFYRLKPDHFVMSQLFGWEGALALSSQEFIGLYVSPQFPTFLCDEQRLNRYFLGWFARTPSFWQDLATRTRGMGDRRRTLNPEALLSCKIPLPPLDEQRRIVARIEKLAVKVEEARHLYTCLTSEVDDLIPAISAKLFDNPSWPRRTVEDLVGRANLKNGLSVKSSSVASYASCLRLSAIRDGRIDLRDSKPVPLTETQASPYWVQKGDVFIVRGNGSKALVGRAATVQEDCTGVIFPDLFIRVPLKGTELLGSFFTAVWNSRLVRRVIEEMAKTTSGIWKINQGHIASVSIPVPSLDEQQRVLCQLNTLRSKVVSAKDFQSQTAMQLDALVPSILSKAFRGEL